MRNIRVNEVSAGMMAGQDICDRSGRLLISSGTLLNDSQIRTLKTWGISEITVAGENTTSPLQNVEVLDAHLLAAKELVKDRFRFNDHDLPAVAEFEKVLTLREATEMAKKDAH
ncbi:MAG: hypothetical protein COB04_16540 [Gammaproteobacteria bacterium]|nr:MAG: hypothetical protein COB04_16540 [Gammaproteobacteria bacterium]